MKGIYKNIEERIKKYKIEMDTIKDIDKKRYNKIKLKYNYCKEIERIIKEFVDGVRKGPRRKCPISDYEINKDIENIIEKPSIRKSYLDNLKS